MVKCLVILSHSFRTNSRIFKRAVSESDEVAVLYPSPWYWNEAERDLYNNTCDKFHKNAVNHFAYELKKDFGIDLHILKSKEPVHDIQDFCADHSFDLVLYDLPLFGKDCLEFPDLTVQDVDSDSYDPECLRMTAKSRWTYWVQNRTVVKEISPRSVKPSECLGEKYNVDISSAESTSLEINSLWKRVETKLVGYFMTRNERDGSTRLSAYLHQGLIDGPTFVSNILSLDPGYLEKGNPLIPILRQLAFREISIRKARTRMLSLTSGADEWAQTLLDEKSYNNLTKTSHEPTFTKESLFKGSTGQETLDREIKLCLENRWMPNRARMWFAGEVYWGLGGGIKSLNALVEFFNANCDDAQSPNNWVSCVESMRMQYGKVMRFNEKRTFRLLSGEERI